MIFSIIGNYCIFEILSVYKGGDDKYGIGIEYPNFEIGGERYWQFSSDPGYYRPNYDFGQAWP